jgi:hypothetical protein
VLKFQKKYIKQCSTIFHLDHIQMFLDLWWLGLGLNFDFIMVHKACTLSENSSSKFEFWYFSKWVLWMEHMLGNFSVPETPPQPLCQVTGVCSYSANQTMSAALPVMWTWNNRYSLLYWVAKLRWLVDFGVLHAVLTHHAFNLTWDYKGVTPL